MNKRLTYGNNNRSTDLDEVLTEVEKLNLKDENRSFYNKTTNSPGLKTSKYKTSLSPPIQAKGIG